MHASRNASATTDGRCRRERDARPEQAQARMAAEHERLRQEHAASCLLLATLARRHGPLD